MTSFTSRLLQVLFAAVAPLLAGLCVAAPAQAQEPGPYSYMLPPVGYCANDNRTDVALTTMATAARCVANYVRRTYYKKDSFLVSSILNESSARKTIDIENCGFSHTACGRAFNRWHFYYGLSYSANTGENIARGQGTARRAVEAWVNSSGHRYSIGTSTFKRHGLSVRQTSKGLVWVHHFSS